MSEEHSVSRRASLKSLGAIGAAMVFSGATPSQAGQVPARSNKDEGAARVAELAVDRMAKGHS